MTKFFNFALKIKGGGGEGGTCEVLRPCHPQNLKRAPTGQTRCYGNTGLLRKPKITFFDAP